MNYTLQWSATDFENRIDSWVLEYLSGDDLNFPALLRRLPSVYPTAVLASLERLRSMSKISDDLSQSLAYQAKSLPTEQPASRSLLPLPHPLNYEWRFTSDGSRKLLDLAGQLTGPGQSIVLFGTPGVALEALAGPLDRQFIFLGEDNGVTRRLHALNTVVGNPLSILHCESGLPLSLANAIIVDPPWYMDFIRPMLAASASVCRPGGYIIASLPPGGVRRTAQEDRIKTVAFAKRHGLELLFDIDCAVGYETPFFEANALRAVGIRAPYAWRHGDLVVFQKVGDSSRPISTVSARKERWSEIEIGRMRLFIRRDISSCERNPTLCSIVPGDILPTVSRRDPARLAARVWTSGNRLFACDNPEVLLAAAVAVSGNERNFGAQLPLFYPSPGGDQIAELGYTLRNLAAVEANEERQDFAAEFRGGSAACKSISTTLLPGSSDIGSG